MATKLQSAPSKPSLLKQAVNYLEQPVSVAPLVTFRIGFGLVMLFSTLRYIYMGWVDTQLINPVMHFHYYGFHWVEPLPGNGMYGVFALMVLATIAITLGWYYRLATTLFFLCFSYVELIDLTFYLNHYYFVSLVSFLLILVPANKYFSLDTKRTPRIAGSVVSRWCIGIFKLQIAIVYVYAGLAKITHDWLLEALPLSIWLPAKSSLPLIGFIFDYEATAYLFSWAGMLFDTFIVIFLLWKRTRLLAYLAVVVFHALTGILFQIGVFPLVMILGVTIFFSDRVHHKIIAALGRVLPLEVSSSAAGHHPGRQPAWYRHGLRYFLVAFVLFQLLFPWRYLLYPGNIFWTEEGYRFAWRVMLMEKAGTATFYVKDGPDGREGAVRNREFLHPHQEKQMAMQPDMILQFAHYLAGYYREQGMSDPRVRADVRVTLNARPARQLIDPQIDLTKVEDQWKPKSWILPFSKKEQQ